MDLIDAPTRQLPLTQQVEQILLSRIRSGRYPPQTQLPTEVELADEFKVSRATIRSALNTLATMGVVVRRHGAGTFVTHFPRISNPLDQAIDFQELIARYCCRPTIEYGFCGLAPADERMSAALQVPGGASLLISQKVFRADGEPVIFCLNTLPAALFTSARLEQIITHPEILEPFFQFVETELELRVEYYVAHMRPMKAKNCLFYSPVPIAKSEPLLVIDEIAYSAAGRPIYHTFEYHPENKMDFEIIRRRPR